jgi:hypothetical protein
MILYSWYQKTLFGWWFGTFGLVSKYWKSSSQVTFIFFRGAGQPPTRYIIVRTHITYILVPLYTDKTLYILTKKADFSSTQSPSQVVAPRAWCHLPGDISNKYGPT